MIACLGTMYSAKNIIIVGDLKQLPQVDSKIYEKYFKEIEEKFDIPPGYKYWGNNILKSIKTIFGNKIPTQLLREHYRCHPGIIGFCNQKYYNNELILMKESNDTESPFVTLPGISQYYTMFQKNGKKISNEEMSNIVNYLKNNMITNAGVIVPYKLQAKLLDDKIKQIPDMLDIRTETVHKFQGQEKEIIFFGTTENRIKKDSFVAKPELINVAVSRAINKFILVHASNLGETPDNDIKDLYKYINYNYPNSSMPISKNTEFYLLAKEFKEELKIYKEKSNNKNKSLWITEMIALDVLEKIISNTEFSNLEIAMFRTLSSLVPNAISSIDFTEEKKKFLSHPSAHVDFVLFNKFDRKIILAIEIDGVSFHTQEKQIYRDKIKDEALKYEGIHLLRIRTDINASLETTIINELRELKKTV